MRQIIRLIWMLVLSLQVAWVHAAPSRVEGLNFSSDKFGRLVFELDSAPKYRYFTLKNPSRVVVDFENTVLHTALGQPPEGHALALAVRSAVRDKTGLRVVVELNDDTAANAVIVDTGRGAQLRVDLTSDGKKSAAVAAKAKSEAKAERIVKATKTTKVVKELKAKGRDILIAIDAGHGGKDVGAQGPHGIQEKDVVLAIAKRLESAINRQPGMRAVMIRNGDYFVKLRERVEIARKANADLFVSIHADAFNDPSAHGASVYTLANRGASSQMAQFLADSENASDILLGGGDKQDDVLASVLMDLSNKAAKEASQHVASRVLKSVDTAGHLHRKSVQKAGFVVLKSSIPSILVETAFISNPEEEKRLSSHGYQDKMATAVFHGILAHFKRYAPSNTLFAQLQKSGKGGGKLAALEPAPASLESMHKADAADKAMLTASETQHVISRGDTLSGIARQYGVSMRQIRTVNGMVDGNVKVGQVLQIPRSS